MKISKQARRSAKQLFRSATVNGVLDEARARSVVKYLVSEKPRGYAAILSHFQRLAILEQKRRSARIESAVPLSRDLEADIRRRLESAYGQGLTVAFAQNPQLIGGLRVQVGSDVYDGSVQSRLKQLQETL